MALVKGINNMAKAKSMAYCFISCTMHLFLRHFKSLPDHYSKKKPLLIQCCNNLSTKQRL